MKPVIYFIRHGQTDWNAQFRFQGQKDIPINALGREQARRNGKVLRETIGEPAGFDFVASPLSRTRETMEIVRGELGLASSAYRTDERLLELCYGDWEGLYLHEMQGTQGELTRARNQNKWEFVPPGAGAESYAMQAARFSPWLDEVDSPTVCVTHGGILRCVWNILGGVPGNDAGQLTIRQDKLLRFQSGTLEWI